MSENLSCRVARVDDADCLGLVGDNAFDLFSYGILVSVFGSRRDSYNLAPCLTYEGLVVGVERLCHDNFIIVVENCSHKHVDSF